MAAELRKLLQLVLDKKAVELQLRIGSPPRLRLRGVLRPLQLPVLTRTDTLRYLRAMAPEGRLQELREKGRCNFEITLGPTSRFAVSVGQDGLEMRRLPEPTPVIRDLDRRLARRLDMPLEPYSSDRRLADAAVRFAASFGCVCRASKRSLAGRYLGKAYARAVENEAALPAELCSFLLDVLDGKAAASD